MNKEEIGKPIARKEVLKISKEIQEQAEGERYGEKPKGKFKWVNDKWCSWGEFNRLIIGVNISTIVCLIINYFTSKEVQT